jgi:hypothetical protein
MTTGGESFTARGEFETTVRADILGNPRLKSKKDSQNKRGSKGKPGNPTASQPMLSLQSLGGDVPYPKPGFNA